MIYTCIKQCFTEIKYPWWPFDKHTSKGNEKDRMKYLYIFHRLHLQLPSYSVLSLKARQSSLSTRRLCPKYHLCDSAKRTASRHRGSQATNQPLEFLKLPQSNRNMIVHDLCRHPRQTTTSTIPCNLYPAARWWSLVPTKIPGRMDRLQ